MRPIARPESVGSRRGRRIAILLAVLLLVGLPLYLWPLRGGIEGLPGAAALSGPPPDPRSAKAVAQLPADVWDGLMGHHAERPVPSPGRLKAPGNLTRIHPHEEGENAPLGSGSGGFFVPRLDPGPTSPLTALLTDASAGSGGDSSGGSSGDSASSPSFAGGTSPSGGGAGGQGGSGWSPFQGGVGPFGGGGGPGGGEGAAPPTFTADPGPSDPPMPTPEPGTLLLVGSHLALVGAVAWRRLSRRQERKPSG